MAATTEPTAQQIPTLIHLAALTHLEGQVRAAKTVQELQFLAVNETRRLVPYQQAFLLIFDTSGAAACRVGTASSVAVVEREAPLILWLEQVAQALRQEHPGDEPMALTEETCPASCREGWRDYVQGYVFWCPLKHPDETVLGAWWFEREFPWQDNDVAIVHRLASSYAYAWKALSRKTRSWSATIKKPYAWLIGAVLVAALCVPVRVSTVAPVKVMAKDPAIVSAPMDGVIAEVVVPPNTMVLQDRILFRYEDTNIRNQFQVADKQLAVARAEHAQAVQAGFADPQRKADAPLKDAEVSLKETEREYAQEMLEQIDVRAPQTGLLLYTDKADWVGKPVSVGERIMEIADPQRLELRIDLPVSDSLMLRDGAEVVAFFDALPLESFAATVSRASYHAEVLPGDVLAYRVMAELSAADPRLRIGWQGSAKVYGERGPLAFLLFRRPVTALRQLLGV
ncbi:MAG: HlyD family efflux transporter periplasmic adaptor subunit [Nitrospira sp.]